MEFHTIMTHHRPHLDEIVAIAILQQCGREQYPGIENATYTFCDAGEKTPQGKSWKKLEEEGIILVGVGGGRFDEHATKNKDRKDEECAATLVAKHLGLIEEPWLKKLLEFTTNNDLKGGSSTFDMGAIVNRLNKRFFDQDPVGSLECCVHMMVLPYIEEQILFFAQTKEDFEQCTTVIESTYKGRPITIVAAESDNTQLGAYARSKYGANADVVIQKNSKGNVVILTKKMSNIKLHGPIIGIRNMELKLKNIPFNRDRDMVKEGVMEGVEEWQYNPDARQILNGSASAITVPPTKIHFNLIVKIVKERLAEIRIASDRPMNIERKSV